MFLTTLPRKHDQEKIGPNHMFVTTIVYLNMLVDLNQLITVIEI